MMDALHADILNTSQRELTQTLRARILTLAENANADV